MIVSHKHKFIFIRAPKTASTSLQVALARQCGPEDIITDIKLEKTELAARKTDYRGATDARQHKANNPHNINPHAWPTEISKYVGDTIWRAYFKIVVVRNPWDQAISENNYSKHVKLKREFGHDAKISWQYYFPDGHDFGSGDTGRYLIFENLEEDYRSVCDQLGLTYEELPWCKTTYRNEGTRDYRTIYTDDQKALIDHYAKHIIEYFGYDFDKPGVVPIAAQ